MTSTEKKIKISNRETERMQYGYFSLFIPIIIILFAFYKVLESKDYEMIYGILFLAIPYGMLMVIYPKVLKQLMIAHIDSSNLHLRWINKTISIRLDQIESIEYYKSFIFLTVFFEKPIAIKYKIDGKIKQAIIIPTNLTKGKKLKRNLNIKGFVENRISEYLMNNKDLE